MRSGTVLRGLPVRLLFLTAEVLPNASSMNLQPFLRARGEVAGAFLSPARCVPSLASDLSVC